MTTTKVYEVSVRVYVEARDSAEASHKAWQLIDGPKLLTTTLVRDIETGEVDTHIRIPAGPRVDHEEEETP